MFVLSKKRLGIISSILLVCVFVFVFQIANTDKNTTVNKVQLYNLVGQLINAWDVRNDEQSNILIPMSSNSTGVYIVKVETTNGSFSKKVSVK